MCKDVHCNTVYGGKKKKSKCARTGEELNYGTNRTEYFF